MLSLVGLQRDPSPLTADLRAGDGSPFTARLLRAEDAEALGCYLDGLSERVRRLYRPHPLDAAHARVLCAELDYQRLLPFLAWVDADTDPDGPAPRADGRKAVAAYFLVGPGLRDGEHRRYTEHGRQLVAEACYALAPCVADAWQGRGLGSALLTHVVASLRCLGGRHLLLWGGVRGDNPVAQGFYRKGGFREVGHFCASGIDNIDMVLDL